MRLNKRCHTFGIRYELKESILSSVAVSITHCVLGPRAELSTTGSGPEDQAQGYPAASMDGETIFGSYFL